MITVMGLRARKERGGARTLSGPRARNCQVHAERNPGLFRQVSMNRSTTYIHRRISDEEETIASAKGKNG